MKLTRFNVRFIALALGPAVGLVCGCAKEPEAGKDAPPPATAVKQPATQQSGGGSIAPMGGVGAGPMTPVAGTDSVQGGGSGVGSALKAKAKGIAKEQSSKGLGEEDSGQ